MFHDIYIVRKCFNSLIIDSIYSGAVPRFFLEGDAHSWFSFFTDQNTNCIRKPPGHLEGGVRTPLHPPPGSAPDIYTMTERILVRPLVNSQFNEK